MLASPGMSRHRSTCREPRRRHFLPGLVLFLIAMLGQIGAGAVASPVSGMPRVGDTALAALGTICHAGPTADREGSAPLHHRGGGDCALCPFCLSLASPAALLAPPPDLRPGKQARTLLVVHLPQARAPPGSVLAIAYPRGPPILI